MSAANEKIRQELGFGLIAAERDLVDRGWPPSKPSQPDPRKQADEQCNGVNAELLKGIVLQVGESTTVDRLIVKNTGNVPFTITGVTYFTSFGDFELWDRDSKESKMARSLSDYISSTCKQHLIDDDAIPAEMMKQIGDRMATNREISALLALDQLKPEEKPVDVMAVTRQMCK